MNVYVVGNSIVKNDRLPIALIPRLRRAFPCMNVTAVDPNEQFIPEEDSVIIDTVHGITDVQVFDSLDAFEQVRSVTPHDYDLGFHLRLLQKLRKISRVTIVGVPPKRTPLLLTKLISVLTTITSM